MANYDLLNEVCRLEQPLVQIIQKTNRLAQLGNSIQQEEPLYATYPIPKKVADAPRAAHPSIRIFFIGTAVFACLYYCLCYLPLPSLIANFSLLIWLALTYFLTYYTIVKKIKKLNLKLEAENEEIEERNLQVRAQNQDIMAKCGALSAEIKGLQQQIAEIVNYINYPPDYVCLDAVRFFIHGLRNDRADDFRRLIDLYEQSNYRQRMQNGQHELLEMSRQQTYNQERLGQLMNYSNALSAANLAAQLYTQAEVRALHDTVRGTY